MQFTSDTATLMIFTFAIHQTVTRTDKGEIVSADILWINVKFLSENLIFCHSLSNQSWRVLHILQAISCRKHYIQ